MPTRTRVKTRRVTLLRIFDILSLPCELSIMPDLYVPKYPLQLHLIAMPSDSSALAEYVDRPKGLAELTTAAVYDSASGSYKTVPIN